MLAFVVELTEEQLAVAPIHRLLTGLPGGMGPEALLGAVVRGAPPTAAPDATIADRMASRGRAGAGHPPTAPGCCAPRPAWSTAAAMDLDSSRLDVALAGLPEVDVRYQHGWDHVVGRGRRRATPTPGVLLRPATVAQIADVADRRRADAAEDHVLHAQAGDRHGVPGLDDQR